jgi:hypothetical protein
MLIGGTGIKCYIHLDIYTVTWLQKCRFINIQVYGPFERYLVMICATDPVIIILFSGLKEKRRGKSPNLYKG